MRKATVISGGLREAIPSNAKETLVPSRRRGKSHLAVVFRVNTRELGDVLTQGNDALYFS